MDLNKIELNPSIVASLYKYSLVEILDDEKTLSGNDYPEIKYLGNNKKNILFAVQYESILHLPDDHLSLLINMLTACKLSLGDVAIFNTSQIPGLPFDEVKKTFKPKNVFLFGIAPKEFGLPVNFPYFQLQQFDNCAFLYAPRLEELEEDRVMKSKLWVSLRKIFSI